MGDLDHAETAEPLLLSREGNADPVIAALEIRIKDNLARRLNENQHYQKNEIENVVKVAPRLFPHEFVLGKEISGFLRHLAIFSPQELKPTAEITSHRRFLGPLIVRFKKLFWPLIYVHLRKPFESLEEFHSGVLGTVAWQAGEIHDLRKKLIELEQRLKDHGVS